MSAYVTQADLVPAYLEELDLVQLTQDDGSDDTVDTDTLDGVIVSASAEVDGYLGARYSLPFDETPQLVKDLTARVVVYQLYRRRGSVPEQTLDDYKRVEALLTKLSKGVVTLGTQPEPEGNSERLVRSTSREPVFGRDKMDGF